MEVLFDGIDLGAVTTSMTINSPAAMIFAMYLVVANARASAGASRHDPERHSQKSSSQKEFIIRRVRRCD